VRYAVRYSRVEWARDSAGLQTVVNVVHASSAAGCHELTSRITRSAWSIQVLLLPMEELGLAGRPRAQR